MTAYVLIWVFILDGQPYTGSAEFNSKETCVAAGKLMVSQTTYSGKLWPREMIECVKK